MVVLGLLLGLVGTDVNSGQMRFTFGIPALAEGISFAALAMGMFGVAEVIYNLEQRGEGAAGVHRRHRPRSADARRAAAMPVVDRRAGPGSARCSASCPAAARCWRRLRPTRSRRRSRASRKNFGDGDIRGVAAPEAANNAGAQTSFIPMLTLGVPSNPTMALMIGALMIQGIQPGPQAMVQRPELFWGIVASMWIGNLFLLLLNLPLIGLWVRLLAVPYRLLFPAILMFCCIGVFIDQQQPVRSVPARGVLGARLCAAQARLRARAARSSAWCWAR